jgi:hypothetical protein
MGSTGSWQEWRNIHSRHNMAAVCHQETKIESAAAAAISLIGI